MTVLLKSHKGTDWGTNSQHILRRLLKVLQAAVKSSQLAQAIFSGNTILTIIIIIIIIIFINCNWVVTRWQWLFYMYTNTR